MPWADAEVVIAAIKIADATRQFRTRDLFISTSSLRVESRGTADPIGGPVNAA
jgi:hypothetical protein